MFDRGYQNPDEMEVLSSMTEGLLDFAKRYNIAINDPDLIRRYRMIEDGKRDIATKISVAETRGREEGLKDTSKLFNYLWENGKGSEAKKAEKDMNYLNELLEKYKDVLAINQ